MIKYRIVDELNEQITNFMRNNPIQDFDKNLKSILLAVFNKLDLVTREEFDVQQKVLVATRKKLEELEEHVKQFTKLNS
jgi:BMFP domain-containing protein YqiC